MFWKKKDKLAKQPKQNKQVDCSVHMATILKRTTRHTKSIVCGKLYDTEHSERISRTEDDRLLFVTQKGNYFSCTTENDEYISSSEKEVYQVCEIIFSDIRPETLQYARENIGRFEPEKYIEMFGEVEEA